ncbi:MAG: CPBP family intramembrane metalloprotease [Woeseiaceae bacterium]|nr:CPBP family intramembrane metalloprotease [Woeseiaceae bacterium]
MMRFLILALGFVAAAASADDVGNLDIYDVIKERFDDVYEETIAEYGRLAEQNPGDIVLAIRHCEAIEYFSYSEDYYNSDAEQDAAKCFDELSTRFPGHIESMLADTSRRYDDNVGSDLEFLADNHGRLFNQSQVARLYLALSEHLSYYGFENPLADVACIEALERDVATNCRIQAATHLHRLDQTEAAIAILTSPLDPYDEPYYRLSKIQFLADLEASDAIATVYRSFEQDELTDYIRVQLSVHLAEAGLKNEAMRVLDGVSGEYWDAAQLLRARYDVAMSLGDFEAAHGFYYELRSLDGWSDPLLRTRFELAAQDMSLGWRLIDLVGLFWLFFAIGLLLFLALIIPGAVHYRGLVRAKRGLSPGGDSSVWSLKHSSYSLFIFLFVSIASLYIFEYDLFFVSFFGEVWEEPDWLNADLGRMLLGNSLMLAVLILPLALLKGRWRSLGASNWSIGKCILVGLGLAVLFRILFAIPVAFSPESFGLGEALLTPTAIRDLYLAYGFLTVFFITAILTPLVEEIAFRGAILQGFSSQVTWTGSNLLQAAIFASLHESLLLFPFYVGLAFVGGVIVRRAGGLLPAIIMHAVFNGIAVSFMWLALSLGPP